MSAGSRYSDQERREAAVCYLLHGNWRRVSELTGIPQRTLSEWGTTSWFGTLLAEVRAEKGAEFDGALTRVLDKATAELLDRLQYGDPYIVAGEVKRRPVSARDLAIIAGVAFDKRQLSRNLPTQSRETDMALEELAHRLEAYGKAYAKERGWGQGQIARGED